MTFLLGAVVGVLVLLAVLCIPTDYDHYFDHEGNDLYPGER